MNAARGRNRAWTRNADALCSLMREASAALYACHGRAGVTIHLPARGRLLLTGDLHDNLPHFEAVCDLAKLDRSSDNHVVLHELIHGDRLVNDMDMSFQMLGRAAELVLAYPHQVHPVLANHELSQFRGHAVSKGGGDQTAKFTEGLEWIFGDEADAVADALDMFIAAMPLAVRTEGGLQFSHSLPGEAMLDAFDVGVLNRELGEDDYESPFGAAFLMTWGRGHTDHSLDTLGAAWGVRLFVIGHMNVPNGVDAPFKKLVTLASDHAQGRVIPLDLAEPVTTSYALLDLAVPIASFLRIEGD